MPPDLVGRWARVDVRRLTRSVVSGCDEHDLLTFASAIAFQVITAVVPLALLVLGLLGTFHLDDVWRSDVRPEVAGSVSAAALEVVDHTVDQVLGARQVFWVTLGAALCVWQVSGAVRAATDVLNRVHGAEETRPWTRRYGVSFALAVALVVVLLGAAAVVVLVPLVDGDPGPLLGAGFFVARWGAAGLLLLAGVGLLLHFGPDHDQRLAWTSFGSVLIVGSWLIASGVFLVYLTELASYGSVFGALATVVVLSGYLYLSAIVFVLGAEVDALLRGELR